LFSLKQELLSQYDYDSVYWNFGDGSPQSEVSKDQLQVTHVYNTSRVYPVEVQLMKGVKVVTDEPFVQLVEILPGKDEMTVKKIQKGIWIADLGVTVTALLLASLTGLIYLYYVNKVFGSPQDYIMAFLWGFGIDASVKGFASVLGKFTT
jgi:hypothetical protein